MDQTNQQTNKSLLEELGLNNLPNEEKEALTQDMTETILQRVFNRVLPQLSEADNQALDKLADNKDTEAAEEEVIEYLSTKVPNFEQVAQEETQKYIQEVKNELSDTKSSLNP